MCTPTAIVGKSLVVNLRVDGDRDWDVAPLPKEQVGATWVGGAGYGISSQSKNVEAAWKFVRFAAGPEGSKIISAPGTGIPASKTALNTPGVWYDPTQPPANIDAFIMAGENPVTVPKTVHWNEITPHLNFAAMWRGEVSVRETVTNSVRNINTILGW